MQNGVKSEFTTDIRSTIFDFLAERSGVVTTEMIGKKINKSKYTAQKYIKIMQVKSRIVRLKPSLTINQKLKRLHFAKQKLQDKLTINDNENEIIHLL